MAVGGKGSSAKSRADREARERSRLYQARAAYQAGRAQRRVRDNWIAGIAGGIIILAAVGGQIAYFTVGPGAPAPTPTPSPSLSPTPTPTAEPPTE